ncbi:MFS transporter [Actinocatenispora thailandica]|uniref:MFS transporter n=1 Tax=Actinocatenispora thailandica TaxID=227318 RepID=A0A7R7HZC3_9ACTN|nr:MFS transporter [Actinocatenispora thailandica]BCJ38088.1 MFS transporter [Actinocatenispora thailandica]
MGRHRAAEPDEPVAVEVPGVGSRWVVLALLSASLLIIAMDATILNVALPALVEDLHANSVEQLWIVDGYALALSGLLVTAGAMGDRTGRRRVLLIGYGIFGVASLGAVMSTNPAELIASRVGLGVGGAAIMPATLSMLRQVFTEARERTFAFGVWSAVFGAGMALGPLLGGWLLEHFSWHAVFLINVPIAMAAMVLGRWLLPDYHRPVPSRWDWAGVVLSILAIVGIANAIKLAGKNGLRDPVVWVSLIVAVVCGYAFVRNSLRRRHPLLDVRLFARRGFTGAVAAIALAMFGLVGLLFLTSQWFQYADGDTPLEAGVRLLPLPLALIVGTLGAPALITRFAPRYVLALALLLVAVGMAVPWFAAGTGEPSYPPVGAFLALTGLGAGASSTIASVLLMASSPADQAGSAAAVDEVSYELGGAFGVAALGSLAVRLYRAHLPALPAEHAGPAAESVGTAAQVSTDLGHPPGTGGPLAGAFTAFGHAFVDTALVSAVILLLAALVSLALIPSDLRPAGGGH